MTILIVALNVAVLIGVGVLMRMLNAYGVEKGKNLATKEDIAAITHEIEGVRSQYSADLERLRTDLARGLNIHKARYETELRTYQEIWKALVPLYHTTLLLRPTRVFGPPVPPGAMEEHKRNLLDTVKEEFNAFADLVYTTRPFYPESVYVELIKVMQLAHGEAQALRLHDPAKTPDYWDKAQANADAIIAQFDKICDTIRARLAETGGGIDVANVG